MQASSLSPLGGKQGGGVEGGGGGREGVTLSIEGRKLLMEA